MDSVLPSDLRSFILIAVLQVSGLGRRFGARWVFKGISFELKQGDRLAVTGPNGTGKSTLLRCIVGLLTPSEGSVRLPDGDSRCVVALSALEMALYPSLTCSEHLRLAADLRGCEARDGEMLKRVGLEAAANQRASQLSTGMKSRLKLALAIQPSPLLLALDEPGAALDESGKTLLDSIVAEQAERGVVLFATNDPGERRLANLELALENTGAVVG